MTITLSRLYTRGRAAALIAYLRLMPLALALITGR
jgi:hypothetical protein